MDITKEEIMSYLKVAEKLVYYPSDSTARLYEQLHFVIAPIDRED